MKGFLALALQAMAETDPGTLAQPLALLLTYDEEVGTRGARDLVEAGGPPEPLPRRTIVGEPTSLVPARLHKGHLRVRVTLAGRAAHSLRRALEAERPPQAKAFPEVPFVPLNVGWIPGGSAVNVIPDQCEIEIGARLLPGMDTNTLVARLVEAVERAAGEAPRSIEILSDSPPALLDDGSDLWAWLSRAIDRWCT